MAHYFLTENVTGSPNKVAGSLSFKAQDCLQSVNDTVQEIKRVASAGTSICMGKYWQFHWKKAWGVVP